MHTLVCVCMCVCVRMCVPAHVRVRVVLCVVDVCVVPCVSVRACMYLEDLHEPCQHAEEQRDFLHFFEAEHKSSWAQARACACVRACVCVCECVSGVVCKRMGAATRCWASSHLQPSEAGIDYFNFRTCVCVCVCVKAYYVCMCMLCVSHMTYQHPQLPTHSWRGTPTGPI